MHVHADTTSTTTSTPTMPATQENGSVTLPDVRPASAWAQIKALAGAEWRLLRRNKVALLNTLLAPGLIVLFFAMMPMNAEMGLGIVAPMLILGMALIFVVYYTLVTALVARREAYVLQRLRTGEASDATILTGLATPFAVITVVQTVLCIVASIAALGVGMPANPALLVVAIVLGTLVWTLLGIASTGMTRSVEHAQITTMPLIFVALLLSGISVPLALLPEWAQRLCELTPMNPVITLMRLGMGGVDAEGRRLDLAGTFAEAASPTVVLIGWCVLGVWLVRRHFAWEPRR